MISVEKIKPKMLSDFLNMDIVNNGKVTFSGKEISIQSLISIFCFDRYKKIPNIISSYIFF
jgi:hypothetical protein